MSLLTLVMTAAFLIGLGIGMAVMAIWRDK